MKKTSCILALTLALAMLISCVTIAAGGNDYQGLACEEAVTELMRLGIVNGYPDGSFKPERPITRAEIAKILSIAKTDRYPTSTGTLPTLTDIKGHWAESNIVRGVTFGLILGYPNGTFAPNKNITYGETAALCIRLLGYNDTVLPGIAKYFEKATELGIMEGITGKSGDTALRGDVAQMLLRAMKLPIGKSADGAFSANAPQMTYFELLNTLKGFDNSKKLVNFMLCGYYEDNLINAAKVAEKPALYLWSKQYGAYTKLDAADITAAVLYNFVAVCDSDADGAGDALYIVNRADSADRWDAGMDYIYPEETDAFTQAHNIPYGERLLGFADADGYLDGAAADFSNIVKAGDLENATYWADYDWYNSTGKGSLTLLGKFKTTQQSTGWACGVTCATMVLDWYGLRGDLNELDLSALRNTKEKYGAYRFGSATDVKMFINVFDALNKMEGKSVWQYESTYDFVDADGNLDEAYLSTDWILERLNAGKPILVGWNSFGGHWQVIIGYDTMGTEGTADDVLILADPYDSTDHRNDGVNVQSYERLYYDWTQTFDRDFSAAKEYGMPVVFVPTPVGYTNALAPVKGAGLMPAVWKTSAASDMTDKMLIPYGKTADDLAAAPEYKYSLEQRGANGLAGPASSDWYRKADVKNSPYYPGYDFYSGTGITDTLDILKNFKTSQQASEWTCGPSSLRMVFEWFGMTAEESEFTLAHMRDNDKEGATTLDGITAIFAGMSAKHGQKWDIVTTDDLDDDLAYDGHYLEGGSEDGLIPFFISQGIPVLIGWDEWGGHWQVIIGYDDMGTDGTQDDVIVLADPYDTTDHNQDGYVVESYERLIYGWGAGFDSRGDYVFAAAVPVK